MSQLPPPPVDGVAVLPIPTNMSVGIGRDGIVLSVHIPCGLLGFVIDTEAADALAQALITNAAAVRMGITLTNGHLPPDAGDRPAE